MGKANSITRNSNIELLRIISMLMVLVLHCLGWSGALEYLTSSQYWAYWWMEAASIIAVDVFVIISGYFLVESKFKAKNVMKIAIGEVWLYSVVFSMLSMYISDGHLSMGGVLRASVPILTKKYWFVNSYLAMYILSPFINKMIHSLSRKQFSALTIIMICMFSLRVTVLPITWAQDSTGGMGLLWFLTLYCVSAWLRLYYEAKHSAKFYFGLYFLMTLILVCSKKILLNAGVSVDYTGKLYGYPSIIVLVEAASIFLAFLNLRPISRRVGKTINSIAKHSFSVYIIHFAILGVLFTKIIPVNKYIDNTGTGIVAIVLAVFLVYTVCTIIDCGKTAIESYIGQRLEKTKIAIVLHKIFGLCDDCVNG